MTAHGHAFYLTMRGFALLIYSGKYLTNSLLSAGKALNTRINRTITLVCYEGITVDLRLFHAAIFSAAHVPWAQSQEHHTCDNLEERGVKRGGA